MQPACLQPALLLLLAAWCCLCMRLTTAYLQHVIADAACSLALFLHAACCRLPQAAAAVAACAVTVPAAWRCLYLQLAAAGVQHACCSLLLLLLFAAWCCFRMQPTAGSTISVPSVVSCGGLGAADARADVISEAS